MLLHRLQQRRLRFRACAVDLIGHEKLREDRPFNEAEGARASLLFEHLGADDIRRHEVGRKLNALGVKPKRRAQRIDERCLGEARNPDQEGVSTRENVDKDKFDNPILSEDDPGDRILDASHFRPDVFDTGDYVWLGGMVHRVSNLLTAGACFN